MRGMKSLTGFSSSLDLQEDLANPNVSFQEDGENNIDHGNLGDNGLLCSSWISKLNDIIHFMSEKFEMTSGPVGVFVGIQISKADPKN